MRRLLSCRGHLPSFTPGMAGRRSRRNGCFGGAAAGAGRSMRALSRLADVAGFWTLDRTTITGRSAVILRQHTTPFRPMIVPFDDLELVYQSPYAQISARQCAGLQISAHSTLGRERFFKARLNSSLD